MIIISPSKNLNLDSESYTSITSKPLFSRKTSQLVNKLKDLNVSQIGELMDISKNLSKINHERFQHFHDPEIKKPAAYIFSGDTFQGLSIRSLDESSIVYAQQNLRILSGLYGILRPLDVIQPYRLEMGTNMLSILGTDLYKFWEKEIVSSLINDFKNSKGKFLFNLSSNEYFKSINISKLDFNIVNFDFKKKKGDNLSSIGMMIKKLRGAMAKFIIEEKISNINTLKKFTNYGFTFHSFNKKGNSLLFTNE